MGRIHDEAFVIKHGHVNDANNVFRMKREWSQAPNEQTSSEIRHQLE